MAPFTSQESPDPRELWKALQAVEDETGARVMAIAHNGNLSNGMMFPSTTVDGEKSLAGMPKPERGGSPSMKCRK